MKSLSIFALSLVATAVMATQPVPDPAIVISGNSTQAVSLLGGLVKNYAGEEAEARQNLASNAGNVTISGNSSQSVSTGHFGLIWNMATGEDAFAQQNLSSNVGQVTVSGNSTQMTSVMAGAVFNVANADSVAVQNIASNNSCYTCAKVGSWWPF